MEIKNPVLIGRYWHMQDGCKVRNIAGGSGDEPTVEELQEQLKNVNAEAAARRTALKAAKEELSKFDGIDVDEYNKALKAKKDAEQAKLKAEGDFEALLESKTSELKTIISQKDEQLLSVTKLREKEQIDGSLISALSKHDAHSPDELSILLRDKVGLDDTGAFVKDGDSALVKDGKRVSISDFVKSWLDDRPQYVKAGSGGSGGTGGKGKTSSNVITRVQFDALPPAAKMEHIRVNGHGSVRD